jgi:hypothetical protein
MSSVEDFADQLFSKEPGSPGSVNLDIDVEKPSEFFEVLLLIVTHGMKKWYGPRIDITRISKVHLELLQEYFLSFGIAFKIDTQPEPNLYMIDNKAYLEKSKLDDMTFTVASSGSLWILHFAFAHGATARFR